MKTKLKNEIETLENKKDAVRIRLRQAYKDEEYELYKKLNAEYDKIDEKIRELESKKYHLSDEYKERVKESNIVNDIKDFMYEDDYTGLWKFLNENKKYGVVISYYNYNSGSHSMMAEKKYNFKSGENGIKFMLKKLNTYRHPYVGITKLDYANRLCVIARA